MADIGIKITATDGTKPAFDSVGRGLDGLKQSTASVTGAVTGSIDKIGMSAKATAAALRGVPAQFTDIAVSLQGGQKPLTVLLQQGGQLKDMFGGAGNAAKALGGYVVGLISPFTLAAAAVGAVGYAAYTASEEAKALQKALALSGTQGVTSVSSLNAIAAGLGNVGVSSGAASAALVEFIGAGVKVDDQLQRLVKAAIDLEKYGGAAVKDTAKAFTDLSKDPLASLDKLTLATYQQIESLLQQGKRMDAVTVAQKAFTESAENTAKGLAATLGPIDTATQAWKRYGVAVFDALKQAGRSIVGAPLTGDEERAQLQQRRALYAKNGYDTTKEDARLAYFKRLDEAQKQGIANQEQENKLRNLMADFDKKDGPTKKLRERNQLIADNGALLQANLITQVQYNKALTDFDSNGKKQVLKKTVDLGSYDALIKSIQGKIAVQDLDLASVEKLTAGEKDQAKFLANLRDGTTGLVAVRGKSVQLQAQEIVAAYQQQIGLEKQNEARAESAKMIEAADKALDAYNKKGADELASINAKAQKLEDQVAAYGLTAEALQALTIARLEDQKAQISRFEPADVAQREIAAIDARIAEIKRLGAAETARDAQEATTAAAKKAAAEWKKTADEINRAVTDSLLRAFENGEGFAQSFAKTVEAMFKTLVLRPIVSAVVSPVSQAVSTAIGIPGSSGGVGGILNTASNLNSIYGTLSQAYGGYSTGASLASLGYANVVGAAGGDSIGALIAANGGYAGVSATGGAAGAAGASSALAAVPGWGWAALAAVAVLGFASGQKQWETKYGGTFSQDGNDPVNKLYGNRTGGEFANNLQQKGISETVNSINARLALLGSTTKVTRFVAGGESDTVKAEGYSFAGGYLSNGKSFANPGQYGDNLGIATPEDVIKAFGADLKRASLSALLAADDVPKAISAVIEKATPVLSAEAAAAIRANVIANSQNEFGSASPGTESAALIAQLIAQKADKAVAKTGLDSLSTEAVDALLATVDGVIASTKTLQGALARLPFAGLAKLSFDTAAGLLDAAGGFDKLNAGLTSYYDNFYSAEEKRQQTLTNLVTDLGAAGITATTESLGALTRAQYRQLVETVARNIDSPESQKAYSALIALSGAFASITPGVEALGNSLKKLQADSASLAIELLSAQGDTAGARAAQRASETAGFNAAEVAVYDYNAGLRDQISALNAAKSAMAGLGDTRFDLENQLLGLQGNTTEAARRTREREVARLTEGITDGAEISRIAAAYDYNVSLQAQITAFQASQQASQQAAQAATELRNAWQSVTDSIFAEVARIRGLTGGPQSLAQAQANFTIASAQASSGDQTAAKALPELSRVLLTLAEASATSLTQLRAIQGQTAGALEGIGNQFAAQFGLTLPKFAVGTNYVPQDMAAIVHKGEAIIPAAYNPALTGGANNDALVAEIQALRAEIAAMQTLQAQSNTNTKKTADILTRVTRGGDAMQTEVFV